MNIAIANFLTSIDGVEEHGVFDAEISDTALERAAALVHDRTPSLTIAFCSGLDTCPHR